MALAPLDFPAQDSIGPSELLHSGRAQCGIIEATEGTKAIQRMTGKGGMDGCR